MENATQVNCPYCKESIRPDAIRCRYCGSHLQQGQNNQLQGQDSLTFIRNALKDRYEIYDLVGKGGMASVYRAKQINLGRTIALKVIHSNLIHDQEFVERFLQEARIGASLNHPNIVNLYDFGEVGGIYYISMEFLDGKDLLTMIREQGRLPSELSLQYISPIAQALGYIHDSKLLHRDIKSANILITKSGRPVLTDFGIAYATGSKQLTVAGTLLGTPEYLSPEQATGQAASPESDFYSLGVVLYECLTGKVPFTDPNPLLVINHILQTMPASPGSLANGIRPDIEDLTMGLLHKDPTHRKPYIEALRNHNQAARPEATGSRPITLNKPKQNVTPTERMNGFSAISHVNKTLLGVLILMLSIILGGIIFILVTEDNANQGIYTQLTSPEASRPASSARTENTAAKDQRIPFMAREKEEPVPEPDTSVFSTTDLIRTIEEKMIVVNGQLVMKDLVCQRVWQLVNQQKDGGSDQAVRGLSYNQVQQFIEGLNSLQGNPYTYSLPSLATLKTAIERTSLQTDRSEWVSDAPVFRGNYRSGYAKYYHIRWQDEAGVETNRAQGNIYFRLARINNNQ